MEARTGAYFLFVTAATDRQSTAGCSQPARPVHIKTNGMHSQTLAILLIGFASSLVYSCVARIVTACSDSPLQCSTFSSIHKAGQTKFTVYRHNIFYFACGRVVIIQISNEHIGPCVILGVFDLKSDMGVKRAADVTYIHVVTNNRHRLSFPTSSYIFHDRRDKTHCMGDPILYLPAFGDLSEVIKRADI